MQLINADDDVSEKQLKNCVEITTPFLDRHNDWIQIYVEESENNKIYITDDGYILNDLKKCGIDFKTDTIQKMLSNIVRRYEIQISDDNELFVISDRNLFSQKKHMLIQCMMSLSIYIDWLFDVEAIPIKHGNWITNDAYKPTKIFSCSECKGLIQLGHYAYKCYYNYCPNCGAKMDGGENNAGDFIQR